MNPDFWHARWRGNQIGFHEDHVHAMLERHWAALGIDSAARVFVPLCGKSLDMRFLRDSAHEIVGVELSDVAIKDFFEEQGVEANRDCMQGFERWYAPGYDLLVGDFFALDAAALGPVSAVYDRASLIALPPEMRASYVHCMRELLDSGVKMLLITLQYDLTDFEGPPFCVSHEEVNDLYGDWCSIELLEQSPSTAKGHTVEQSALSLTVR